MRRLLLFVIVDVQSERDGRNFSADGPIGIGPYVVTSFTKERAELAANENYWDGDVPFKRVEVPAGIDRDSYAKNLLKDTFIAGKAPLPPSLDYGFKQLKDTNPYNLNRAKTLLAKSGWTDTNGDGIVDESATIFLGYPKINIIGKSYLKGIHISPSEYYVITKDLKKE